MFYFVLHTFLHNNSTTSTYTRTTESWCVAFCFNAPRLLRHVWWLIGKL